MLYNVLLTGNLTPNTDHDAAVAALAKAAALPLAKAEALLASAPCVIKRNADEATARDYQSRLLALGIETEIQAAEAAPAQAAPATEAPRPGSSRRDIAFHFTGHGFEYFKIWIVNILLTLVTLGIYAPWAKVRNLQYFYGNTSLDGASFAFTADPVKMLIGRLIALGLFIVYIVLGTLSPIASVVMSLLLVPVFPWIINKAMAFTARYTSYRNIRFGFNGDYWKAFVAFILWPLLGILTLGILIPFSLYKQQVYVIDNHRYGNKSFSFHAGVGGYYTLCLISLGIIIGGGMVGALLALLAPQLMVIGILLGYGLGIVYFVTALNNLIFNSTSLASHNFKANYELKSFGWLMISNLLLTIVTLGLYLPWAKVRLANYAAAHVLLDAADDLDTFAALSQPEESAFGEEFGDVFDMEFGV